MTGQRFQLAACAEMLWRDKPIEWRAARLHEMGFQVGLWNWRDHDLTKLEKSGATFSIMNGYLRGRLTDDEGTTELLKTARETAQVGKRLGVERLNLHGTGLGEGGLPVTPVEVVSGAMWLKARDTLSRIADMAEKEGVTFTLENLNLPVDHPGVPFGRAEDTLALVSSIDHPRLRLNLDLYHAQIGEGNLIELCRASLPWIGEVQVADVPGRMEPGTGEVNWHAIAKALKAMGYSGPVGMEAFASGDPEAALEAFRNAFTV
ncbi:TIM barrel protein [Mesorhizobium sp. B2-5-13]|uniref:TIM barrel protein n=1 Tax=unclassified Mesorhizobium TaxID=325217 RepID=UPI00112D4E2A|nr:MULTISPECIES: TIM barrel protein [unclassified Mesorhizobium]TPJ40515.1 TIM barrel protein [Mesorhizobium sp. B2-6-5]TPJ84749.1 TIM barrel protein [Mesorhizobium sp. B2-5-13]TPK50895.1 TIM barrel protein [Mesorhizobium sp. B2-5-5]